MDAKLVAATKTGELANGASAAKQGVLLGCADTGIAAKFLMPLQITAFTIGKSTKLWRD